MLLWLRSSNYEENIKIRWVCKIKTAGKPHNHADSQVGYFPVASACCSFHKKHALSPKKWLTESGRET